VAEWEPYLALQFAGYLKDFRTSRGQLAMVQLFPTHSRKTDPVQPKAA